MTRSDKIDRAMRRHVKKGTQTQMDFPGQAKDLAGKLTRANRNIDELVALVVNLASGHHMLHSAAESEYGQTDWQHCYHPNCILAWTTLQRIMERERK
jgi:hypothetical protein